MRHGGQILIDQLREEGCDTAFCVPGESFLAALDGLHGQNDIRTIVCRQEGGVAMMAEAYAKMTGKLGVAFVTRGIKRPLFILQAFRSPTFPDRRHFPHCSYKIPCHQFAKQIVGKCIPMTVGS